MITLLNKLFSQSKNLNYLNLSFKKLRKETEVKKIFKVITSERFKLIINTEKGILKKKIFKVTISERSKLIIITVIIDISLRIR